MSALGQPLISQVGGAFPDYYSIILLYDTLCLCQLDWTNAHSLNNSTCIYSTPIIEWLELKNRFQKAVIQSATTQIIITFKKYIFVLLLCHDVQLHETVVLTMYEI